jgi:transposase
MRQIKEVLRLRKEHQLSVREIARGCGLPSSTVGDYLKRAEAAGLSWPLPAELGEAELQEKLLGAAATPATVKQEHPEPDWPRVQTELGRTGVTLLLLWREYRREHSEGYGYSRFCELYGHWAATLEPTLRQVHAPGEKMFVDWAGPEVSVRNEDGTSSAAYLFVAVLGASNKTYAEAFPDMRLPAWIAAHVHAFAYFGGVVKVLVPDNTRTAVTKACRYEPTLHRTYQEMAAHYGAAVVPARPVKPRDKAKVETGVQIAERSIMAPLRDRVFFSVADFNQTARQLMEELNARPFQKLPGSRNQWFEEREKAALGPLPAAPFELAVWTQAKANIDYHVLVDKHYYSVPHGLVHQSVEARLSENMVELFHNGNRVAAHPRSHLAGRATTLEEHRPKSHQKHLQWTPGRLLDWAGKTGPQCRLAFEQIMSRHPHPEQGYRSCLGLLRLGQGVGSTRLEAACRRALLLGACSYHSIKSILHNRLDEQPLEQDLPLASPAHDNLRGSGYYA